MVRKNCVTTVLNYLSFVKTFRLEWYNWKENFVFVESVGVVIIRSAYFRCFSSSIKSGLYNLRREVCTNFKYLLQSSILFIDSNIQSRLPIFKTVRSFLNALYCSVERYIILKQRRHWLHRMCWTLKLAECIKMLQLPRSTMRETFHDVEHLQCCQSGRYLHLYCVSLET